MHDGDKDSALDCPLLLYLGPAILPLLLHQVLSVPPRKAKSGIAKINRLSPVQSLGNCYTSYMIN